jgi:hypothetical protein
MPNKKAAQVSNDVAYPLFITMIDSSYLPAIRNFKTGLQKYHLEKNLIVVCLDDQCIKVGRLHGLFIWTASVNMSVAEVKVSHFLMDSI